MRLTPSASNPWRWPLVLGMLVIFGLLAALLGQDDFWLWLSWTAMLVPLAVIIRFVIWPRRAPRRERCDRIKA